MSEIVTVAIAGTPTPIVLYDSEASFAAAASAAQASTSATAAAASVTAVAASATSAAGSATNAANSATSAAASAASATSSASSAGASATNAALSAAIALAGTTRYADTTAGLAATAEGGYFVVVGSGDTAAIVYREVAGVAVEQVRYPSLQALQNTQIPLFVTSYGASGGGTPAANLAAFEAATTAAAARGGGMVYIPPANAAYELNIKVWADAGGLSAMVRLPSKVSITIPEGVTLRIAAGQVVNGVSVSGIIVNGPDVSVVIKGTLDCNSINQPAYTGGYVQNGQTGVFIRPAAFAHRCHIGAGYTGFGQIINCFGNPVNGGGSLANGVINHVSVIGLITDNVGEGVQIERANHVEMGRIRSFNTTNVMTGDGSELAGVRYFRVWDIYAENSGGSGFDLFGCQDGTIDRCTFINCNLDIHDFTPVDPCENVTATNILTITRDGANKGGFNFASSHLTKSPKNIKVQGRVINEATGLLPIGIAISQDQDVATYGGGPYDLDIDVEGVKNTGVSVNRAPRLGLRGRIRNSVISGLALEASGLLATDNVNWDIALHITGSGTQDVSINGTAPQGNLGGFWATATGDVQGRFDKLSYVGKYPALISSASDLIMHKGATAIRMGGAITARIQRAPDGHKLTMLFTVAGAIYPGYPPAVGGVTVVTLTGANFPYVAGTVTDLVFDAVADVWRQV